MLDLSADPDLRSLAAIVGDIQDIAAPLGADYLIIGATARDLVLKAHGLESPRLTKDVDFAFLVRSWRVYSELRDALIESGSFAAKDKKALHRLIHGATGLPVDIVPFGGIENDQRMIFFPSPQFTVFDCFGVREAYASRFALNLPGNVSVHVASIPAQVLLKIVAFNDRKLSLPGRDAPDLLLLIRKYIDCGVLDKISPDQAGAVFEAEDFDVEIASAQLIGREIRGLLDGPGLAKVLAILAPETDPDGNLLLVRQSNMDDGRALRILTALVAALP